MSKARDPALTPPQERILVAAERLFVEAGFGVSLREIAVASGQRNHSAVQYHFGDRAGLVDALYRHRMVPLNARRAEMVREIRARGDERDVEALLRAYIVPMAEHLLARPGQSWYLRLMARFILSGVYADLPFSPDYYAQFSNLEEMLLAADPCITQPRVYLVTLHVVSVLASLETRLGIEPGLVDRAGDEIEDLVVTAYAVATAPAPRPGGERPGRPGWARRGDPVSL
ncbi:TetR/AcrR family transcriptional regulator [Nocardioides sp.]|uniref:TetR/AcrR family transcriptional regulator n=1 Tax=Nocardioides sp. TaxID=35761 RepID=UPI002734977F|nr:TetR/AcrR family transcriptional regulator [Nocardioides sp.]MDP3889642.1 TetR/AcrR family transcriptional regulator [Nocardioides sp.]